jgi:hypothetical protein
VKGRDTGTDGMRHELFSHLMPNGRAVDIHEISETTRQVLTQLLDPLATSEPDESLPKL